MATCAQCLREIPDSATVCDHCGHQTTKIVSAASVDAAPENAAAPVTADRTAERASDGVGGRRELLVFVLVALAAAIVTLALLMGHRASSAEVVAAAQGEVSTPAPSSSVRSQSLPAASVTWGREHQAQWVGNRPHSAAFELPADNTVSIWLGRVRPILVVRCVAKNTEAFVFTGSAIKIEPRTEDHTVTFGFDDGAEVSERWPDSAEHDALFAPDGAAFAVRLTNARTMRFGYTPHNATPVVAQFHVSGLGPLIDPVARDCGWKP